MSVEITEYLVLPEGADRIDTDALQFAITIRSTGNGRWAIQHRGWVLSTDRTWDLDRLPSDRTDEWLNAHRFNRDDALTVAQEESGRVKILFMTWPQFQAWGVERVAQKNAEAGR